MTAESRRQARAEPGARHLPRPALRIGITGHRIELIEQLAVKAGRSAEAHEAMIADALESVLMAAAASCDHLTGKADRCFSRASPLIGVVVGAAFGVDRIAATIVSRRRPVASSGNDTARPSVGAEWRLETVLPAPLTLAAEAAWPDYARALVTSPDTDCRAAYAEDWRALLDLSDSITELPALWRPAPEDREPPVEGLEHFPPFGPADRLGPAYRLSYVEAAAFQLRQIDLLIAVWDGESSRGPGGVADIVAHAHTAGIPVVFIDAAEPNRAPAMLRGVEFAREQPNVLGWSPQPLEPVLEAADCRDAALAEAVRTILLPPQSDGESEDHVAAGLTITDFADEPATPPGARRVYRWFMALFGGTSRSAPRDPSTDIGRSDEAWRAWVQTVGEDSGLAHDILALHRRYNAVSRLANAYAARYRSAFVTAFGLAALAGGLAVIGEAFFADRVHVEAALILAELVVLFAILIVVRNGRRRKYHAKYLEYRSLAESLHNLRFLCAFAEAPRALSASASRRWFDWYVESVVREIALPSRALDATYQRRVLRTLVTCEIEPQIRYHEANAQTMRAVDGNIHRFGRLLFASVIVALFAMFALLWEEPLPRGIAGVVAAEPWLGIVAALFPAIGSALAAIRSMADFDGRAMRSAEMVVVLRDLADRAERGVQTQDVAETRHILRELAATLSEDVEAFRATFGRRELVLPS